MSKENWVNKKKDLEESDTAVKKEKTLEEKRDLAKRQIPDMQQDIANTGKMEAQSMRQDVAKSGAKESGMQHRAAKFVKKKAVSAVKATGAAAKAGTIGLTGAAGKVITDTEIDAGGHPEGNMFGVLANQANTNSIISKKNAARKKQNEKKQTAEKKTAGAKVKNTAKKIGEKGVSVTKGSMTGMTAVAGQVVNQAESGVGGCTEGNAFSTIAEQTNQTRQMMTTLGKVPDRFKKSTVSNHQDGLTQDEKAKRC